MRTLRTSVILFGAALVLPMAAQAQDAVEPENVELQPADPAPSAAEPAPEPAPAPAPAPAAAPAPEPAAQAEASVQIDTSAGVQADAAAEAAPPEDATDPGAMGSYAGPVSADEEEWKFGYSGYFRAPMRFGIGSRSNAAVQPTAEQAAAVAEISDTTLHPPVIPDDQYLSWQHTRHAQRDWAELFFSYGNSWAKGTLGIQGFNFTDASWTLGMSQFGVSQGWITITPYMPWENVRLIVKAGSFWNRYGSAGKYDAGEYDTFLFGRTHTLGEDIRVEIDADDSVFGIEQGFGTKQPDPSVYNRARFTLIHHEHVDWKYDGLIGLELGAHFLHPFTMSEAPLVDPQPGWVEGEPAADPTQPNGSMLIYGIDAEMDLRRWGHFYIGFSRIDASNATTIAPAVEVLHANGGGEFTLGLVDNYLDSYQCRTDPGNNQCSNGNGAVNSVLGQWDISLSSIAESSVFGAGRDLGMKFYAMFNNVESDDPIETGTNKLKFGADLLLDLFPVLALGFRADHLRPRSYRPEQNFSILSPRLVFRSQMVTHEQISLQYSRYIYAQRTCANAANPDANPALVGDVSHPFSEADTLCVQPPTAPVTGGFGAHPLNQDGGDRATTTFVPDLNVITLEGSMWW